MRHDVWPVAVDLEPGDRLVQRGAVEHVALRARRRAELDQPGLHRHDVLQALDVAPRNRQHPDLDPPLERICREARPTPARPSGCSSVPARMALVSESGADLNRAR